MVVRRRAKKAREQILNDMESDLERIKDPIPIPIFSNIMKDSDDNLLFFEFQRKKMLINLMFGFMRREENLFVKVVLCAMNMN